MLLFIVVIFLNFRIGFSVGFPRSNQVVVLYWLCRGKGIDGKIVIEKTSTRFEKEFYLEKSGGFTYPDAPIGWVKSIPVDIEKNSTVTIQLFRENKVIRTDSYVWNPQGLWLTKKFDCLEVMIRQCSLSGPAKEFYATENCQTGWSILTRDVKPVGYLTVYFYTSCEQDLSVTFLSKWEEETFFKRDFDINTPSFGMTSVWDVKNLKIRIGDGIESELSIRNHEERQIFWFPKFIISYVPYVRYTTPEFHLLLYIYNKNDPNEKFVITEEITVSIFDKQKHQPCISSIRILGKLVPGNAKIVKDKIIAFQEAKYIIVQMKGYYPRRARDVIVFPIIHRSINHLKRQIVIPGSKGNFLSVLILSKNPIISLSEMYLVKINARPDTMKFEFCVKSDEKPCEFKDADRSDSYQQFYVSLNLINKIVLRCGSTEWILSTTIETEESTTSIDISGIHVEVNISRRPRDQNNYGWPVIDEKLLYKFVNMKNE